MIEGRPVSPYRALEVGPRPERSWTPTIVQTLPDTPMIEDTSSDEKIKVNFYSEGLKELLDQAGKHIIIPQRYLHGTQRKDEYRKSKRKQVEALLDSEGVQFLFDNPVIACAIPRENGMTVAVIDGHHRARFAPLKGIKMIPTVVLTLNEMCTVLNRRNEEKGENGRFEPASLEVAINANLASSLASFDNSFHEIPDTKISEIIPETLSLEDLQGKFASF